MSGGLNGTLRNFIDIINDSVKLKTTKRKALSRSQRL